MEYNVRMYENKMFTTIIENDKKKTKTFFLQYITATFIHEERDRQIAEEFI